MSALVALWQQMSGFPYDPVEGDPIQRGILLSGYIITLPTILFYRTSAVRVLRRSPLIWYMVIWAAATILWSASPDITFRRVIGVLLTTLYALVLYLRYPFQSFIRLLGAAFFIAVLSSLVMAVFKPDWGIMGSYNEGAWEGVFIHKNSLGKVSVFALCFFATLWSFSRNRGQRIFWAGAFVLGMVTLLESRSVSGLVVFGTMVLGAFLLRVAKPLRKVWPMFLLVIIVIGSGVLLLTLQNSEVLLDAFGRDVSLTGRVPLWEVLIPIGLKQPLGYGYGAFWLGWNGPSAAVWSQFDFLYPNAHNGFLEIWLDLGWVGIALSIFLLARIFLKYFGPALTGSKEALCWMLFCIILVTYNLVEVNFFNQNNIYWVLVTYAYLSTQLRPSEGVGVGINGSRLTLKE